MLPLNDSHRDMIDSEAEYEDPISCDYVEMRRKVGMKPRKPQESDCCHSDCGEACVFERYDTRIDRWRALRKRYVKSLPEQQPATWNATLSAPSPSQNPLVGKDIIVLIDEKLFQEKVQEVKDESSNDEYESDTC